MAQAARRTVAWMPAALWLGFAAMLAAALWLLLGACGVRWVGGLPMLAYCPALSSDAVTRRSVADRRHDQLLDEVRRLELAMLQRPACPAPEQHAQAQPPAPPPAPPPRQDIPQDAWNKQDVRFLEGCWTLDTDYSIYDPTEKKSIRVKSWEMCFDKQGKGQQTLVLDNGAACKGAVESEFEGDRLRFKDRGDLPCEDQRAIYERHIDCDRADATSAACISTQPETGGRANVTFHRRPSRE